MSATDSGPVIAVDVSGFPRSRPSAILRPSTTGVRPPGPPPTAVVRPPARVRVRKRKPIFRRRLTATAVWRAVRPRGYVCVCVYVHVRARACVRVLITVAGPAVRLSCVQWPKIGCRRRRTYRTPPRHTDDISSGRAVACGTSALRMRALRRSFLVRVFLGFCDFLPLALALFAIASARLVPLCNSNNIII